MKKICVGIPSEPSLREIMEAARIAALDVWPVVDAGYTEFDGPTLTCAAIGPDEDERIDAITGGLKLL